MRRAIKCMVVVAAALALVGATPTMARCTFGSPIQQGVGVDGIKGQILTSTDNVTTGVIGYWWTVGSGDPATGAGNDHGTRLNTGSSLGADGDVITRDANGTRILFNWTNAGVDGCLEGQVDDLPGEGVMAVYLVDDLGNYAVVATTGTALGTTAARHDFDKLLTGVGAQGADVPLVPFGVAPVLSNVVILDGSTIEADIAPAADGINYYDDGNGPYSPLFDTSTMSGPCPDDSGCHRNDIPRDADLCWGGQANVIGGIGPETCNCVTGDSTCLLLLQGKTCGPPDNVGSSCPLFGGVCEPGASVFMGPPISGDCLPIAGPTVDDNAVAHATKQKGFTVFTWEATQFAVSHWNILDVTKGDRRVNHDAIARKGGNDGSVVSYEFVATGRDVRGGKTFELELIRTDGSSVRFPID